MTFSLIDELRKELAKTEQLIEFDISKRDQLIEAIRILEANELVRVMTDRMRDFTLEEEKAHANVLNSIGEVVEENIFDEKPKRLIYTIRNNEPLVKLIIPAEEYEAYRNLFPDDDAIEVCVENDEMSYAAGSAILVKAYRPSLTKEDDPQLFADVLDMLEREKFLQSTATMVDPLYVLQAPCWNYNGASAIEVAVTKDTDVKGERE